MKLLIKSSIPLESSKDKTQSEAVLSLLTFDENKKRKQTIYYRDIKKLDINKEFELSREHRYIGIILVKKSYTDNAIFQFPLILIDTKVNKNIVIELSKELIYKYPIGKLWKRRLEYIDFENNAFFDFNKFYDNDIKVYVLLDDIDGRLLDEDSNYIILDNENE